MVEILKNMFRRKTRTILTIFGITIGIFAFTVMGSMAEKISQLVNGGTRYYSDKVTIIDGSADSMGLPTPMSIDKGSQIAKVPGVAAVSASAYSTLSDISAVSLGPPPYITGSDLNGREFETFIVTYKEGRAIKAGDTKKVAVGADLVKKLNAKVGGSIQIKGKPYQVVGIMNKTLTAPDSSLSVSLADAQQIMYNDLPEIIKQQTAPEKLVNGFTVYVAKGTNPDALATRINKTVSGVKASGPKAFQDEIANATGILNAILFGVALISLLVGGLSIINTMTMSISERTREIGIKKAVGAKTRNIMTEYLTEAGLIGLSGGVLGWGLGSITVITINRLMEKSGNIIFLLTPRISIFAVVFAGLLGVIAGIYPAYYAVKINIVKALREG